MKERPILFNGEMVRAILNGSKTQTRRLVHKDIASAIVGTGENVLYRNPFGKAGDRLWVRETFVQGWDIEPVTDCLMQYDDEGNELPKKTWYRATDSHIHWSDDDGWETNVPWKPSIHMPRWASRITLEVIRKVRRNEVRVVRYLPVVQGETFIVRAVPCDSFIDSLQKDPRP